MAAKLSLKLLALILVFVHVEGLQKYPILDDDDDGPEDELEALANELQSEPVGDGKEQHKYDQAKAEAVYDNGDRKETQGNERASKEGEEKTGGKVDSNIDSETEKILSSQPVKIMSKNRLMIPGVSKRTADDIPDLKKKEIPQEEGDEQYYEAERLLSDKSSYSDKKRAVDELLAQAMSVGNTKAKRKLAYYNLLGFQDIVAINFTRAFELFTELANVGNPAGQHGLGFMYSLGLGVNASQAKAMLYYTFGALGGDLLAQMTMGYRYLSGLSVDQSCESALVYYSRVAEAVASEFEYIVTSPVSKSRVFEEESDSQQEQFDDDLLHYYEMLADKGELQAQLLLSQFYMTGMHGVERNLKKALHHLNQAANEGHAGAYASLGKIYLEGGNGVEVDYDKAFDYFTKAATLKEGTGLAGLGIMFLRGLGVAKDKEKAYSYLTQGASRGSLEGHAYLGELLLKGIGTVQNYRTAQQHLQTAAQHGHPLARFYLGYMFTYGKSLPQSCLSAVDNMRYVANGGEWSQMFVGALEEYDSDNFDGSLLKYLLLGELGYEKAQSNAAHILETYHLEFVSNEDDNFRRSLMMWKRAAAHGYPLARLKVGDYYYYGWGTDVDYEAAVNQYQIASDQLLPQAMFNLGYMYEHGLGLKQDYNLAKRYYDQAAEISEEATVPVALALLKLNYNYFVRSLGMDVIWSTWSAITGWMAPFIGENWDMYVITALGLLVGLIYLIRQNR